ncbi:MAG: hypothetical protein NTW21_38165 [Verrucomicrobia bacterium]|nr:hypothetical protein [Verrucomicrobiota bacterium]
MHATPKSKSKAVVASAALWCLAANAAGFEAYYTRLNQSLKA